MKRLVALCFHAPGLWLVYGIKLGRRSSLENAVAIGLTLAAMGTAGFIAGGWAAFGAWLAGHFAWGAWLASTLDRCED